MLLTSPVASRTNTLGCAPMLHSRELQEIKALSSGPPSHDFGAEHAQKAYDRPGCERKRGGGGHLHLSQVQTVKGSISGQEMGVTLPHEHVLIDLRCVWTEPSDPSLEWIVEAKVGNAGKIGRAHV